MRKLPMKSKTTQTKLIELSVIVPCYNEKDNLPLIVQRFSEVLPKNVNAELVLVNNGSTDGSGTVMKEFAKKYKFINIVTVDSNIGYGFGVLSGLKNAKGEYLCWTHADMQTDLKDAFTALDLVKKTFDPKKCFAKGRRFGRPLFDRFFTNCMSVFETAVLGKFLYDINAQPNLFHKSFLENIKNPPEDFSFDLYFYYVAMKNKYEMIRFPVFFGKRMYGESHWNTSIKGKWKFIKRTILFTVGLKKKLEDENV